MPRVLKFVLGYVYVQIGVNVLLGVMAVVEIVERIDHNQRVRSTDVASVVMSFVVSAALLWAAVVVARGVEWGRQFLIALESTIGVIALIGAATGLPLMMIAVVLVGLTIHALCGGPVRSWFAYKDYHRRFRS